MTTFVALLRGINVGGNNRVPMKELKEVCAGLGLLNARTVLASGNLVFEASAKSASTLAARLQEAVKDAFAVDCRIIVLTAEQFESILSEDPLIAEGRKPDWLTVMFCDAVPSAAARKAFLEAHDGPEIVEFGSKAIYVYFSEGLGRSKLALDKIRPPIYGTVRNRNTLKKLRSLLSKPD